MKKDPITKMYEQLTNKERAALALHYLADTNELELRRVESSVPWKSYDCVDFNYRQWVEGFFQMTNLWAITHWRLSSHRWAALAFLHMARKRQNKILIDEAMEGYQKFEERLLALDKALEITCQEHGLDLEAARKMAGTEVFVPTYPKALMPDADYQDQMQKNLSRCLPL